MIASRSRFLRHLLSTYGHLEAEQDPSLALVIYLVKKPHTEIYRETAVTYWIRENREWRLAAFGATD
jgi:hypothetical protein